MSTTQTACSKKVEEYQLKKAEKSGRRECWKIIERVWGILKKSEEYSERLTNRYSGRKGVSRYDEKGWGTGTQKGWQILRKEESMLKNIWRVWEIFKKKAVKILRNTQGGKKYAEK